MSKIDLNDLSSMQYDVLKELGNIGAGNATTALSQLVNAKIDIGVPQVRLLGFDEISTIIGSEEKVMVGILLMLSGDVQGIMMFLMDPEVSKNLSKLLMGGFGVEGEPEDEFTDMEKSAVMEIGNIIAGAYLRSLGELTNLTIDVSVPMLQIDMAGAILSVPAIEFGKIGDKVLLIETAFDDEKVKEDLNIKGYYILVPELESYEKILSSLGV
ncbi:MAG: chemotaxis protein CheC [Lachnospiraceae bacterium]|nr:chemotaxis protein CheC [Lachnospiraceae bacterium]